MADARAESDCRYEGWRVAGAASSGVFVSFASLRVYTFGVLLKPLAEEFAWSRESVSAAFGIAAMTVAAALLTDRGVSASGAALALSGGAQSLAMVSLRRR